MQWFKGPNYVPIVHKTKQPMAEGFRPRTSRLHVPLESKVTLDWDISLISAPRRLNLDLTMQHWFKVNMI